MLSVLPIRDKEKADMLSEKEHIKSSLGYIEYSDNTEMGYILFGMNNEKGEIRAVKFKEDSDFDLMVRTVLSNLYDIGFEKVVLSEQVDIEAAKRLNFINGEEREIVSIKDILYNCKNCRKK